MQRQVLLIGSDSELASSYQRSETQYDHEDNNQKQFAGGTCTLLGGGMSFYS